MASTITKAAQQPLRARTIRNTQTEFVRVKVGSDCYGRRLEIEAATSTNNGASFTAEQSVRLYLEKLPQLIEALQTIEAEARRRKLIKGKPQP